MKLNIGCGLIYKKGCVNIDAFNDTVADHKMSVVNLGFDDNVFSHVDCIQVIEHLGAAASIYALSEIYRVLQPNGHLLIETPDLAQSFKSFLSGNEERRKFIMNWIYGLDTPGMSHRYGFPEELLVRVLGEVGFKDIQISHAKMKSVNPTLRAECRKSSSPRHQALSRFRKRLVDASLVNLDDQIESLEKELLLQQLTASLGGTQKTLGAKQVGQLLETSLRCPGIGLSFLSFIVEENLVGVEEVRNHVEVIRKLEEIGFIKVLVQLFKEMPLLPGQQDETIRLLLSIVSKSTAKILSGDPKPLEGYRELADKTNISVEADYFSKTMLEQLSSQCLARGIKAFALGELSEAEMYLLDAVRLNRDSIIAFWNIGRTFAIQGKSEEAIRCLEGAKGILLTHHPRRGRELVKRLDSDIKTVRTGNGNRLSDPILALD